jgi:hypothetical protein
LANVVLLEAVSKKKNTILEALRNGLNAPRSHSMATGGAEYGEHIRSSTEQTSGCFGPTPHVDKHLYWKIKS